jgi:DNA-binding transcriptional ArsR family regulator
MSEYAIGTTPFGRRSLTLAHVASQATAKARPPDKAVHKWQVFRAICTAKAWVGVSERALAVLDALLSFHPETTLSGDGLIVFPSNQQLALRAHGMAPATLRRHLAALVDCGLIIRRDSPNGKRFARKGRSGAIEMAFGFDLSPLVARAEQLEAWAEDVRAEERALRLVRERITLCRRDIAKMIATGVEEGVPTRRTGQGQSDWAEIHGLYRRLLGRIPRTAAREELEPIAADLTLLADEILSLLESHVKLGPLRATCLRLRSWPPATWTFLSGCCGRYGCPRLSTASATSAMRKGLPSRSSQVCASAWVSSSMLCSIIQRLREPSIGPPSRCATPTMSLTCARSARLPQHARR